jgi:hypothetical protein
LKRANMAKELISVKREGRSIGSSVNTYDFSFDPINNQNSILSSFPVVRVTRQFAGREYRSGPGNSLGDSAVLSAISSELSISLTEANQRYVGKMASTNISFDTSSITTLCTMAEVLTQVCDLDFSSGKHAVGLYLVWAGRVFFSTKDAVFIPVVTETSGAYRLSTVNRYTQVKEETSVDAMDEGVDEGGVEGVDEGGVEGVDEGGVEGVDEGGVEGGVGNVEHAAGVKSNNLRRPATFVDSDDTDDESNLPLNWHRKKRNRVGIDLEHGGIKQCARERLEDSEQLEHSEELEVFEVGEDLGEMEYFEDLRRRGGLWQLFRHGRYARIAF